MFPWSHLDALLPRTDRDGERRRKMDKKKGKKKELVFSAQHKVLYRRLVYCAFYFFATRAPFGTTPVETGLEPYCFPSLLLIVSG